jgi:electron transfer flavoprotein alpha subunit
MSTLVIAEHDNGSLKGATLNAVTAAQAMGADVDILVAGANCGGAAEAAAAVAGVGKVLVADNAAYEHQLAENVSLLIAEVGAAYDNIVAPATANCKNAMPRVAALLDVAQISEITSVESADTFKRPIYAGNVIATVQSADAKKVITVRTTAFDAAAAEGGSASIEAVDAAHDAGISSFVGEEVAVSDRPELTSADIVISGGRGMQNGENFKMLEGIADKLGAAIGAKIVAPDLYIAVGISGAIQHLAGMKDSKVIVAINKDEDAPIFQVADYGLVADLFDALPELESKI